MWNIPDWSPIKTIIPTWHSTKLSVKSRECLCLSFYRMYRQLTVPVLKFRLCYQAISLNSNSKKTKSPTNLMVPMLLYESCNIIKMISIYIRIRNHTFRAKCKFPYFFSDSCNRIGILTKHIVAVTVLHIYVYF